MAASSSLPEAVVHVRDLTVAFGDRVILNGLSLDVMRGEILGVAGGSGSGKSVLMRTIIGLIPRRSGTIELFGKDPDTLDEKALQMVRRRWGVMFQQGALFSSLTVRQNIQFQMRETLSISDKLKDEMATAKLEMVGLKAADGDKMPSELSGGMVKRAALARALALDPEFVFLDEPTSGLDPISAREFDSLITTLQSTLGLTVFLVTHDLESLFMACDRAVVLAEGRVVAEGPVDSMVRHKHPWVRTYFGGLRTTPASRRSKSR
jgi:phospholipid/cholesterol/gamma-HCH transport system ATP-binding protein